MVLKFAGVRIVHYLPGRLRLRLDRLRGNPEQARRFEAELAAVPGVRRVQAKPASGSLLLEYRPAALRSADARAELAAALHRLFPAAEAERLEAALERLAAED